MSTMLPLQITLAEKKRLRNELGIADKDRILVIGSTHDPEEEWLLGALDSVFYKNPYFKSYSCPQGTREIFLRCLFFAKAGYLHTFLQPKRAKKRR